MWPFMKIMSVAKDDILSGKFKKDVAFRVRCLISSNQNGKQVSNKMTRMLKISLNIGIAEKYFIKVTIMGVNGKMRQ